VYLAATDLYPGSLMGFNSADMAEDASRARPDYVNVNESYRTEAMYRQAVRYCS